MDSTFSNIFVEMCVTSDAVKKKDTEQMGIGILNTLHRGVVRNGLRAHFRAGKGIFPRRFPIKCSGSIDKVSKIHGFN